jgi:hypothetical protein
METTARTPRRRPGRWTLISGVSMIAVGVLSFNAYASFSATDTYNQDVTSGYMSLVIDDDDDNAVMAFDSDALNMAPGDTAQRAAKLTFAGTIATSGSPTISITDNSPTIFTDGVNPNGLTLAVDVCDEEWTETDAGGGVATYDCGGDEDVALGATEVADVDGDTLANLATSGENHLRFTWSFPSAADNTFNNPTGYVADLDVTISADQRPGTNK